MKQNSKKKNPPPCIKDELELEHKMFYPTGNITCCLNLSKGKFHQRANDLSVNGSPNSVMLAVEMLII